MRAIWKGAVAFGLVNVPVQLYAATGEHEVTLHQVHQEDGGRIRYRKVCSIDGEPVEMSDIAKGYETDDGELVVLTDEDFQSLPLATEREIEVLEFVPADQVDPIMLQKTYYLEPEKTAAKPYALLRGALEQADRMAVVKVALRQRESMAVLRVRDNVICLQTLLWPDEVREADFPILDDGRHGAPAGARDGVVARRVARRRLRPVAVRGPVRRAPRGAHRGEGVVGQHPRGPRCRPARRPRATAGEVVDLLAALQRSVEKARGRAARQPEAPTTAAKPKAKAKPKRRPTRTSRPPRKTRRKAS